MFLHSIKTLAKSRSLTKLLNIKLNYILKIFIHHQWYKNNYISGVAKI